MLIVVSGNPKALRVLTYVHRTPCGHIGCSLFKESPQKTVNRRCANSHMRAQFIFVKLSTQSPLQIFVTIGHGVGHGRGQILPFSIATDTFINEAVTHIGYHCLFSFSFMMYIY